jgi:hypothetical protein
LSRKRTIIIVIAIIIVCPKKRKAIAGTTFVEGTTWVTITRNMISVRRIVAKNEVRSPDPLGKKKYRDPIKATNSAGMIKQTSIVPPFLFIPMMYL